MTALLAGIDFSTTQLDAALIPLDKDHGDPTCPPITFRRAQIPQSPDKSQRCRLRLVVLKLLSGIPITDGTTTHVPGHDVCLTYVEEPYGRYRTSDRALLPIYGALICAPQTHATGIHVQEWRRELGLPGNLKKDHAVDAAWTWLADHWHHITPRDRLTAGKLDEHMAEALLIALAGRQINDRQRAA